MYENKQLKDGIIYKTINLINGKWYIGKDEYNNPDYLGSGKIIKRAIKKYGRENFKKEILDHAYTSFDLAELEKKYTIRHNAVRDGMAYNIKEGGFGGNSIAGYTEEERKIFADNCRHFGEDNGFFGKSHTKQTKDKISTKNKGKPSAFKGKNHTKEAKDAISKAKNGKIYLERRAIKSFQTQSLLQDYIVYGKSLSELASIYNTTEKSIWCYLRILTNGMEITEIYNATRNYYPGIDFDKIVNDYINGKSIKELSNEYNVTENTMREYLGSHGADTSNKAIKKHQINEFLDLYKSGTTITELSEKYNCCTDAICKHLRELLPNQSIYEIYNDPDHYKRIKASDVLEIAELYKNGITIKELATKYKITEEFIRYHLRKTISKEEMPSLPNMCGTTRKCIKDSQLDELKDLYMSGMTVNNLSEKYKTIPKVMRRYLKKLFPHIQIIRMYYKNNILS